MAISIDWATRIIFVPQADLTPLGGNVFELNVNDFRLELKAQEESEVGMIFPTTHNHNTTLNVGGTTLARTVEIINGYTVTFEDGQYAVQLVGANHNIADVTNVNQVSLRTANSAGLIEVDTGGGGSSGPTAGQIAVAVWDEPIASHQTAGSTGEALQTAKDEATLARQNAADASRNAANAFAIAASNA